MIKSGIPYLTTVDLSGNGLSRIWKKHRALLNYEDVLEEFGNVWCVQGLIVIRNNLNLSPLVSLISLEVDVLFVLQMNLLSICVKTKQNNKMIKFENETR